MARKSEVVREVEKEGKMGKDRDEMSGSGDEPVRSSTLARANSLSASFSAEG